jgi:hypothetical protein
VEDILELAKTRGIFPIILNDSPGRRRKYLRYDRYDIHYAFTHLSNLGTLDLLSTNITVRSLWNINIETRQSPHLEQYIIGYLEATVPTDRPMHSEPFIAADPVFEYDHTACYATPNMPLKKRANMDRYRLTIQISLFCKGGPFVNTLVTDYIFEIADILETNTVWEKLVDPEWLKTKPLYLEHEWQSK